MSTPEGRFKQKVKKFLDAQSLWYYCAQDQFTCGIPDIVGCCKGKFFALELKANKGRPTDLKRWTIELINSNGGFAQIVYTFPQVQKFIGELQCQK